MLDRRPLPLASATRPAALPLAFAVALWPCQDEPPKCMTLGEWIRQAEAAGQEAWDPGLGFTYPGIVHQEGDPSDDAFDMSAPVAWDAPFQLGNQASPQAYWCDPAFHSMCNAFPERGYSFFLDSEERTWGYGEFYHPGTHEGLTIGGEDLPSRRLFFWTAGADSRCHAKTERVPTSSTSATPTFGYPIYTYLASWAAGTDPYLGLPFAEDLNGLVTVARTYLIEGGEGDGRYYSTFLHTPAGADRFWNWSGQGNPPDPPEDAGADPDAGRVPQVLCDAVRMCDLSSDCGTVAALAATCDNPDGFLFDAESCATGYMAGGPCSTLESCLFREATDRGCELAAMTDGGTDGGGDGGADGGVDGATDGGSDGGADGSTDGGADTGTFATTCEVAMACTFIGSCEALSELAATCARPDAFWAHAEICTAHYAAGALCGDVWSCFVDAASDERGSCASSPSPPP